ncbi:YhgE/Pip domain-containing protein [Furfurilactobacillus entadae]|uniref:YhgE/Pip domain-containing protein n=1 Tax=Furfurilactobacillus entadae TaxID=2922307 RepID=UPI0035EB80AA
MFKNKFFGFAIIAGLLLTLILVIAQLPVAKAKLQDAPVAVVNLDKGPMGKQITKKMLKMNHKSGTKALHWRKFKSETAVKRAMKEQRYYGALVIPKGFSQSITSLANPTATGNASIKVMVNEGMNSTLSASVKQVLTGIVNGIGSGMQTTMLANFQKLNVPVPAAVAAKLAHPITVKTESLNKTTGLAAASSVFFQPIWLSSLVMSLLIFYAGRGKVMLQRRERLQFKLTQMAVAAGLALMAGTVTAVYAQWILGYDFSHFMPLAMFLSMASFAFMMLFSGVITWLGIAGVAVFGLLLFFSAPLMQLAPEMIPHFYQQWILPWLPMRFLFDGARDMLYYNASFWNSATSALVVILALGMAMFVSELWAPKHRRTAMAK